MSNPPDLYTDGPCLSCGSTIRRVSGSALKYARERWRLSRKELADAAGVSASLVAKVEEGIRSPPYSILAALGLEAEIAPGSVARRRFRLDRDFDSQLVDNSAEKRTS